jgi:D-alanyl-D-alanine carboxypeptidase (penicillin-binding protein 5/6)
MRRTRVLAKTATMLFVLVLVVVPGLGGSRAGAQEKTGEDPRPPEIEAKAWALTDANSGRLLAGKNPDERLPIASTTKIMVALVALEEGVDLDEEIVVSENAASYAGFTYSNVGLFTGDRISVREAILAALVPSGTDAVYALAEHMGDGSVEQFVEMMNRKADSMGLENTHFANPAGIDSPENYSSARDLAAITRAAFEYPLFAETVATTDATITTQDREIEVFNTNELLEIYPAATGVKTGTTPRSGPSLVASAESGDESYITVLLDARDEAYRFEVAQTMLEYGFDNYQREVLVPESKAYEQIDVPYRREETRTLVAAEDVAGLVGPGSEVERQISTRKPPLQAKTGQKIGEVEVLIDGQSVGESPLVAEKGYERAGLWQRTRYAVSGLIIRTQKFVGGLF